MPSEDWGAGFVFDLEAFGKASESMAVAFKAMQELERLQYPTVWDRIAAEDPEPELPRIDVLHGVRLEWPEDRPDTLMWERLVLETL